MIVVGSTTTALLVEALAQAGMLRCVAFPDGFPCQQVTVWRAATWAEAADLAAMHAPCVAVSTGAEVGPGLLDHSGESVRTVEAEALLARSGSIPPQQSGSRSWPGTITHPTRVARLWLRAFLGRTQLLLLSKPAKQEA